jgi:hypothetical protein
MALGELAFGLIFDLVKSVVQDSVKSSAKDFFEQRRIMNRVEDATAEVVQPLLPFLAHENISEDKQQRLIETCVDELRPLTQKPELLFQGSLNGQQIFEDLYAKRDLPQVVIEDDLKDVYALLCPRIATVLCKIPAAVKDWENHAWTENYRRLDEIAIQLRTLFITIDELATLPAKEADETLTLVRRSLAQRIRLEMDLTGLRAGKPLAGSFDDFYVHPEIKVMVEEEKKAAWSVGEADASFALFSRPKHQAIIIAPPGAGKSTWAKWFQRESLSTRWNGIGVRVELRRFASEPLMSVHDLIRDIAGTHLAEDISAERISHWLTAKQVIFIVDGFDEIYPGERDRVYDWILELVVAARGCPFILTSRPLTTDHLDRLHSLWSNWTIEPFDESRIIDYMQRWYKHTPLLPDSDRNVNVPELAEKWRADPTIGPLTTNPLLLSTLLTVHHLDGNLPTGRSQLYRRYVEGMLGLWDDRRQVSATSVPLSSEQQRQIMRGLAMHMFLEGQDQLDEPAILKWLKEFLQRNYMSTTEDEVLDMLLERSGLIVGPGIYSFAHKSIAEYLVAEAVLQGDQRDSAGQRIDRLYLFENRDDDRWNTVTFLWSGLAPVADLESFIGACLQIQAFALGIGILDDQYDRILPETRRRLLLATLTAEPSPELDTRSSWVISHGSKIRARNLRIPSFRLRGLTSRSFHHVMGRAVRERIIVWSDSVDIHGRLHDLLWMLCSAYPTDIDTWESCIGSHCPTNGTRPEWLYWVAESVFRRACFAEPPVAPNVLLATFQRIAPDACGLIPIALASDGLLVLKQGQYGDYLTRINAFKKILELLPNSDKGEVFAEWLADTLKWNLGPWSKSNYYIGDLITTFIGRAEELVDKKYLERNATYENAIRFLQELRLRRDSLPNDQLS